MNLPKIARISVAMLQHKKLNIKIIAFIMKQITFCKKNMKHNDKFNRRCIKLTHQNL